MNIDMGMEFRLISDMHHEFWRSDFLYHLPYFRGDENRVLIIAGDFCMIKNGDHVSKLIEFYADRYKAVVYVPGNHEYYGFKLKHKTAIDTMRFKMNPKGLDNVHFLIRDSVVIDGIRIVGATLWTDLDRGNPVVEYVIAEKMNDFKCITYHNTEFDTYRKYRPADWLREHNKDLSYIKSAVANSEEPCIVVTHHAPSALSLDPRYADDIYGNFGYHSVLDQYIMDTPKIQYWCHGHIHKPSYYKIGSTQILCNPYGYPDEDVDFYDDVYFNAF